MLTIDYREKALRHALVDVQHETRSLPVGDVLCEYGDSHAPWIAERKKASDLATSLKNGHLSEQTARLYEAGCSLISYFMQGLTPSVFGMCAQDQDNPFSNYSYKACKAQALQKCLQEHVLLISHGRGIIQALLVG